MLRMPYLLAMSGASSVFSLATFALPTYSLASSSTTGPTMRQGPHQGAQKSTSTVPLKLLTSFSKFSLFNSTIFSLAIRNSFAAGLDLFRLAYHLFLETSPGLGVVHQLVAVLVELGGRHAMLSQNHPSHLVHLLQIGGERNG